MHSNLDLTQQSKPGSPSAPPTLLACRPPLGIGTEAIEYALRPWAELGPQLSRRLGTP
jgi:hypothetical protein